MELFNLGQEEANLLQVLDMHDIENIVQEEKTLEKERDWLIENEVPKTISSLTSVLQDCLKLLLYKENAKGKLSSKQILFEAPELMRGSVILNGWCMGEGDISIKVFKMNKDKKLVPTVFKTEIVYPERIPQIQDAYNYINKSLSLLSSAYVEKNLGILYKIIDEATDYLTKGINQFNKPNKQLNPETALPLTCFNPPLPQDVILEFNLIDKQFEITAHILNFAKDNQPTLPKTKSEKKISQYKPSNMVRKRLLYRIHTKLYQTLLLSTIYINGYIKLN